MNRIVLAESIVSRTTSSLLPAKLPDPIKLHEEKAFQDILSKSTYRNFDTVEIIWLEYPNETAFKTIYYRDV